MFALQFRQHALRQCATDWNGAEGSVSPVSKSDLRFASTAGHPREIPLKHVVVREILPEDSESNDVLVGFDEESGDRGTGDTLLLGVLEGDHQSLRRLSFQARTLIRSDPAFADRVDRWMFIGYTLPENSTGHVFYDLAMTGISGRLRKRPSAQ